MAQGVGQGAWQFASPDFISGGLDAQAAVGGGAANSPYTTGPAVGGDPDTTGNGAGPVHVSTGASPNSNPAGRAQHWSNILDWRHGPMFWLALATVLYFGLITIRVSTQFGR
jgi:hypothetical protein